MRVIQKIISHLKTVGAGSIVRVQTAFKQQCLKTKTTILDSLTSVVSNNVWNEQRVCGPDHRHNLQLLCNRCNSIKGNREIEYLKAKLYFDQNISSVIKGA